MNILSFDCSAKIASVALCSDDVVLGQYDLDNGNTHSETILPMAESLLSRLSLTPDDIDLFAVSIGPGSFTGLRIGVATVKGLAFGRDTAAIGVSTLEALAENLASFSGILCPVMNARRGQVYTALFRSDGQKIERLTEDSAMDLSELDAKLQAFDEPIYLSGDGYSLAKDGLSVKTQETPPRLVPQSAASVAKVALRLYRAGVRQTEKELSPVYLRMSQAERTRIENQSREDQIK